MNLGPSWKKKEEEKGLHDFFIFLNFWPFSHSQFLIARNGLKTQWTLKLSSI
jgi:hypothetical protein